MLEQRLAKRMAEAGAQAGDLFDQDRAKLAAELDAARARERELDEAGAEASEALAGPSRNFAPSWVRGVRLMGQLTIRHQRQALSRRLRGR